MTLETLLGTAANAAATNGEVLNKTYDDMIHPAAKNIGQAAETLTSALNVLLLPISWAVYGFKHIDAAVKSKLEERLADTPIEELKEPEPNVVIPAYEALRYSLDKEQLKDMYINLIANSMKTATSKHVHPAFVEVIKQLSVFDAELLQKIFYSSTYQIPKVKVRLQKAENNHAGIDAHNIVISPKYYNMSFLNEYTVSLENLERLKVISIEDNNELLLPGLYDDIVNIINVDSLKTARSDLPYVRIIKGNILLTNFGKELVKNIF
jgi:hypothetical protein